MSKRKSDTAFSGAAGRAIAAVLTAATLLFAAAGPAQADHRGYGYHGHEHHHHKHHGHKHYKRHKRHKRYKGPKTVVHHHYYDRPVREQVHVVHKPAPRPAPVYHTKRKHHGHRGHHGKGGVLHGAHSQLTPGGLVGAAVGGYLGSRVGGGNGKLAATAGGTLVGYLVGTEFSKRHAW